MNYQQAREYMEKVQQYGSVLGLDNINRLLDKLNTPQDSLKVVHVAGTNGKGSTMTFLQSILQKAGYRVGRYASPAVFEEREIIRINDEYISEEDFATLLEKIKNICDGFKKEGYPHPTPFEIETALAFLYFEQKKCDVVLIECGMGGMEDATNVFKKILCSVITTVSLDHMKFLGNTIEEITKTKSGIIKEGCPVVTPYQTEEALQVLRNVCKEKRTTLVIADNHDNVTKESFRYQASNQKTYQAKLKMLGTYQNINAAVAVEVALALERQGYCLAQSIESGLEQAMWPGRLEVVRKKPLVVLDGAHNPGAVGELKKSIALYFTKKRITFIMGVLADKDFEKEARMIASRAVKIITLTPNNKRALPAEKLAETLQQYNQNVIVANTIKQAYQCAKETIEKDEADMILAFGSLSYLGELKNVIKEIECE